MGGLKMSRNGHITIDAGPSKIISSEDVHQLLSTSDERVQDLIRESTLEVENLLREIRETIADTEAEIEYHEKIQVILQPDKIVASVDRNFRFAKDKINSRVEGESAQRQASEGRSAF
jgi:hypothetical protein